MLCRFIELENAIKATSAILDINLPTLSPDQWKICKELCLVLELLEEVTKTVSSENYISAFNGYYFIQWVKRCNRKNVQ